MHPTVPYQDYGGKTQIELHTFHDTKPFSWRIFFFIIKSSRPLFHVISFEHEPWVQQQLSYNYLHSACLVHLKLNCHLTFHKKYTNFSRTCFSFLKMTSVHPFDPDCARTSGQLIGRSLVCMYICTYMYTHARPVVYYRTCLIKTKILTTAAE